MILCEAKSGGWAVHDLFKVVGWMKYLDIGRGAFFCTGASAEEHFSRVQKVFGPLGLIVVDLGDFADPSETFEGAGLPPIPEPDEITHWRWVHGAERLLTKKLRHIKNSTYKTMNGATAVLEYHRLVNDGIFFQRSVQGRLRALYAAFQSHPRLSLSCAREMDGASFDPEVEYGTPSPKLAAAMRHGDHVLLQSAFYAEHRARLAILKAAIDLACQKPKTVDRLVGRTSSGFRKGIINLLPGSFLDGLRWLTEQTTFRQYARLWQTFLWSWGGFYLVDKKKQEFAWLSEQCGVPEDEIPQALKAFDEFFPSGGWMTTPGATSCRVVKMVPKIFQGLGAYHRKLAYGVDEYAELGYSDYTGNDLAKRHNIFVGFMSGEKPP